MMHQRPEYIINGGKCLEMLRHGPPPNQAPTLVFLHEGLGCVVAMWRDFPARLAEATGCGPWFKAASVWPLWSLWSAAPVRFMHEEGLIVLPQVLNIAEIEQCIPYRKVKELFDVLFDMPFVPASAMAFDRTATRKADSIYVAGSRPKVRVILDLVPDQTYDIRPVFFKDENLFVLIVKKMGQ